MEIFQYLRLDSDGHLRAYKWADGILSCWKDGNESYFRKLNSSRGKHFTPVLYNTDMEICKQACLKIALAKQLFFDTVQRQLNASVPSIAPIPYDSIPKAPNKRSRRVLVLILGKQYSAEEGRENNVDEECNNLFLQVTNSPRRSTFQDLKSATDDFRRKRGGGGFGSVFEGTFLSDGTKVAIKRLDQFGQGRKEFLAEVKTIGSIHHITLARLVGLCAESSHKLLVYEFMSNGSLDKWIFNGNQDNALKWK
ncbi:s-receptor kinase, putative [Ricinus communis]|uniref:S-receptor kinase, putative n=1 Tax=Ricinus communis TaxID=3988 RepID=B9RQK2_RICCO|nr:s-receptor kinase, putative [Ricinus communis]